jgi:Domain of unknown function (DUF4189)
MQRFSIVVIGVLAFALLLPGEARSEKWGALACALWRDGGGTAHVAVGSANNRDSENEAAQAALSQCREAGGPNCQLEGGGAANRGCGFIAAGHDGGKVWCVTRNSVEAVMARCRELGAQCKTPIGGCLSD